MTDEQIASLHRIVVRELNAQWPGDDGRDVWQQADGRINGPGTLALVAAAHEGEPPSHVDLGFVLNRNRPDVPIVWDCAAGYGQTLEEQLGRAFQTWCECTLPVLREFLTGRGEYADHFEPGDSHGLPEWHCVHGPVWAFGRPDDAEAMRQWVVDNPLLPSLAECLGDTLGDPLINGIKLVFGGSNAEVRVNGQRHDAASARLARLAWPRFSSGAFARVFVLALRPRDVG